MKNLLEYKRETVKISLDSEVWEKFFEVLRNKHADLLDNLDVSDYPAPDFDYNGEFERTFLEYCIRKILNFPIGKLWENLFYLKLVEEGELGYHGSTADKKRYRLDLNIRDKRDIINEISKTNYNLYENFEEYKKFIENSDPYYDRINKFKSELFPLVEII